MDGMISVTCFYAWLLLLLDAFDLAAACFCPLTSIGAVILLLSQLMSLLLLLLLLPLC